MAKAKVGAIAIVAPVAGVVVAIIGYVKQPESSATTHSGLPETAYVAHCIKRGVDPGGRDLDCQPLFLFAARPGCALGRVGVTLFIGCGGVFMASSSAG